MTQLVRPCRFRALTGQIYKITVSGSDTNRAGIGTPQCTRATRRSASFFVAVPLWWAVWGTFGWPYLVRGSSNSVRPATLRLEPCGGSICKLHKELIMSKRSLIVREGHRDYSLKSKPHGGNPITPFILLKGTWLEQAGFTIGLPIFVQVDKNKLTITPRT